MTLDELIISVEASHGPDRKLDASIASYCSKDWSASLSPMNYTSSRDEARTLIPRDLATKSEWLPHGTYPARYFISKDGAGHLYDDEYAVSAIAKTEPLAICAAALRRLAQEERNG